jgi:hypothetical protein
MLNWNNFTKNTLNMKNFGLLLFSSDHLFIRQFRTISSGELLEKSAPNPVKADPNPVKSSLNQAKAGQFCI